ncbi:MAG: Uma2 family endonuclease [Thermoanaerobaculia bacterium]
MTFWDHATLGEETPMYTTLLNDEYWYPTSERLPVPESEYHLDETIYLLQALRAHFKSAPEFYVNGDLFLFHTDGGAVAQSEPDLFVAVGAPEEARSLYQLYRCGKPPCMVIEVTSRETYEDDLSTKKEIYEQIGIQEFFVHDVLGDCLEPKLQGFQLNDGIYAQMEPGTGGRLVSKTTGLILKPEHNFLRLVDATTGKSLLRFDELVRS